MHIPITHDLTTKDDSTRGRGSGNLSTVGDILRPVGYQMIRSIAVKNFRSFRNVSLDDLRAINILVGESASGKTALLEAIRLALGGTPSVAWTMNALRGLIAFMPPNPPREQFEAAWAPLFFDFDITQEIKFHVTDSNSNSASVRIYFDKEKPVTPIVPAVPGMQMLTSTIIPVAFDRMYFSGEQNLLYGTVNPSQHGQIQLDQGPEIGTVTEFFPSTWQANLQQAAVWLSQLRIANRASDIIDVVAKQFNEITDLSPEVPYNVPTIYASMKYRARKMPVSLVSAGINKFISLIIAIKTQRSGMLLIDEIENGIYYKGFPAFWEALHKFSIDNNAQLFVSTHSWECLKAAAELNEKFPDDFSLLQLSQEGGISTARNVKGEDAANAIEHGIEVRG